MTGSVEWAAEEVLSSLVGDEVIDIRFLYPRLGIIVPANEIYPDLQLTFGAVLVSFSSGRVVEFYNQVSEVERLTVEIAEDFIAHPVDPPRRVSSVNTAIGLVSPLEPIRTLWSVYFDFEDHGRPLCVCLGDTTERGLPTYLPDSICVITSHQIAASYTIRNVDGTAVGVGLASRH